MNADRSQSELKELQRQMAAVLFRPLTSRWGMRKRASDGGSMKSLAAKFIKPNSRLSSFERLEIYNRCYWFRVLDCFYDDYPGLLAILGNRKFLKLATAYLERNPSESFTLRNLGSRLEHFLLEEPQWSFPRQEMALDMVRFEWAQAIAFDGPSETPVSTDDILDVAPERLRLGLQPYLSLLEVHHAVDDFLITVKKPETDILRGEASNTVDAAPKASVGRRCVRLPKREKVHLAVHRHDNMLYYKRLEPAAFALLTAIHRGGSLEEACQAAIDKEPNSDTNWPEKIQEWFVNWSSLGWLVPAH
jgi:hypothetical protein